MKKVFYTEQSNLTQYNGMTVDVLRELDGGKYNKAAIGKMYAVRLYNGKEIAAFENELYYCLRDC